MSFSFALLLFLLPQTWKRICEEGQWNTAEGQEDNRRGREVRE